MSMCGDSNGVSDSDQEGGISVICVFLCQIHVFFCQIHWSLCSEVYVSVCYMDIY